MAISRPRAIASGDRLTLVEHLDELRNRLIVCAAVFGVSLALCFWQNHLLLELAAGPLPSGHDRLLTFGVTEPFTTTVLVSTYGAIVLALPVFIHQLYGFILPAFSDTERRVVRPLLLFAPLLLLAGLAFSYFVVMPAALKFLLGFNQGQFNIQVRARDYYSFFSTTMLAGAVVFQMPMAILAVTRLGIVRVTGSPGGRTIINTVLETIVDVVDFGMNAQEAVDAPRFHHQWLPDVINYERFGFSPDTIKELERRGHTLREGGGQGAAQVIIYNAKEDMLDGGSDRRASDGGAVGVPGRTTARPATAGQR